MLERLDLRRICVEISPEATQLLSLAACRCSEFDQELDVNQFQGQWAANRVATSISLYLAHLQD